MKIRITALSRSLVLAAFAANTSVAQEFKASNLGAGYAHLLSVVAQPEISASGVDIDTNEPEADITLDTLHLPYHAEFASDGLGWYIQASAGYAVYEEDITGASEQGLAYEVDAKWRAYNGILEGGLLFPLTDAIKLSAGISGGVASLENDTDFTGPIDISPDIPGTVFDWETYAALYRAHGAVHYDEQLGDYRVKGVGHLTYTYVDSFSESKGFAGFSDDSGAAIFNLDVGRRVNSTEAAHAVSIIGHLGYTAFLGGNRNQLGFNDYFEAGASLGVDKYAAGVLFIFGEKVDGISLMFNYNY